MNNNNIIQSSMSEFPSHSDFLITDDNASSPVTDTNNTSNNAAAINSKSAPTPVSARNIPHKRKRYRNAVSPLQQSINNDKHTTYKLDLINHTLSETTTTGRLTRSRSKTEMQSLRNDTADTHMQTQTHNRTARRHRSHPSNGNKTTHTQSNNGITTDTHKHTDKQQSTASPGKPVQISLKETRAARQHNNTSTTLSHTQLNQPNKQSPAPVSKHRPPFVPRFHREIKNVSQAPHNSNMFYINQKRRNMHSPMYSYELPFDRDNKSEFNQYSSSVSLTESPQTISEDVKAALLRSHSRSENLHNLQQATSHNTDCSDAMQCDHNDSDTQYMDLLVHVDGHVETIDT